jgi:hypothetical protein
MFKKQIIILILFLSVLAMTAPLSVSYAQEDGTPVFRARVIGDTQSGTTTGVEIPRAAGQVKYAFGAGDNSVRAIISRILFIALGLAGIVAILFMVYGGYRYITSGGNEEGAEAGKHILTNSIIGVAVILLAYVILTVVQNAIMGNV